MAGPAAHLHVLVTANTSSATRGLAQVDGQLKRTTASAQKTSAQFTTFAKGAAAGFGIGAAAVAVSKGTQAFIGFDKQMRNVNSIARLSEKRFQAVQKRVLALAGPTAQAPETLAKGLYQLVSSGFDANESLVILRKSAIAATAGMTDTGTAAGAVAAVINAYGLEAKDAGHVSDVLFKTVERGVLSFEELAQQIGTVLPSARALGVPFEQVAAAMATLTKQGFPAAEAATAVTASVRQLSAPSEALKKTFQELGVQTGEELVKKYGSFQAALEAVRNTTDGSSTAFRRLFTEQRAAQGGLALTGDSARKAAGDVKVIGDRAAVAGAAQKAFREQSKSLSVQLDKLKAQFDVLAVQIGTVLVPVLRVVVGVLIEWDKILLKLPKLWIAVATAAVEAGAAIVRAIRKPVGDALSFILRRMQDVFELAGRLPFVGDKFDGLAKDAGRLADQIDNWGDKTKGATERTRNARGPVDALKAAAARLADQAGVATGKVDRLGKEVVALPSKKKMEVLVDIGFAGLEAGKNLIGGGGPGDGWGVGKAIDADVQARAKKAGPGGLLGAGVEGAFNLMGASPILAPFAALGTKFGLSVTSGLRPGSITNSGNVSYHASGRAIDMADGPAAMLSYAKAMASLFGSRLKELIHTPLGFSIKDGRRVSPYAAADHYDHVHVALQKGGQLPGARTGDRNLAMLEDGEFVVNREATKRTRPLLEAINQGIPRFQTGGEVGGKKSRWGQGINREEFPSFVNAVWDRAKSLAHFRGAKPKFIRGGATGSNYADALNGMIHFSKGMLNSLANPQSGNWAYAMQTILHEIAHTQQKPGLTTWEAEGGADIWAGWAAPTIYPKMGINVRSTPPYGYPGYVNRVYEELSPMWWKVRQFGLGRKGDRFAAPKPGGSNLLSGLNRTFPAHYLGQAGAQLSSDQVRAVAERWGGLSPARALQADQITLGESSRHPGIIGQDPGGTLGIGLWQITRGVQGALGKSWIDSRGGDTGMRNPRKNAEVMSIMSGKGSSWSNWYGTRFLQPLQKNVKSVFDGQAASVKAKPRKSKLGAIFGKLRGVMPHMLGPTAKQLQKRIDLLTKSGEVYGDYASRAEALSDPDKGVVGSVFGKDQIGWLNDQLGVLFGLRNTLIDAEQIVEKRRDAYTKAIVGAHKRLKRINDDIQGAAKRRRKLVGDLHEARKAPKKNAGKIRGLVREIAKIDGNQQTRVAERKTINGQLPEWAKDRSTLNTRRGDLLTTLEGVQGVGSPLVRLNVLPQVGVLGGEIFQVQQLLAGAQNRISDSTSAATDDGRADLLAQLLREANLRTAVSEWQFDIFKNFDTTSGLQQFATGGIVQAPAGAPLPVIAHGGEGVFTRDQMAAMGGGQPVSVAVHIYEGEGRADVFIDDRKIDAAVERVTRRQSRNAGRRLPGAGGGGF